MAYGVTEYEYVSLSWNAVFASLITWPSIIQGDVRIPCSEMKLKRFPVYNLLQVDCLHIN